MPPRLTDAEAGARMRAAGGEPLEPYPGSSRPWRVRCVTCGQEVTPRLDTITRGGTPCVACAAKRAGEKRSRGRYRAVAQEVWDARAAAVGLVWLEPVSTSATPTLARCEKCGTEAHVYPNGTLRGRGCTPCGWRRRAESKTLNDEEWTQRAEAVGLEWMEPHQSSSTKRRARCTACSHEFHPTPDNVKAGHGCPRCGNIATAAARSLSDEEWDARAAAVGIEWTEPHVKSTEPRGARCLKCEHEFRPPPGHVRSGTGCPRCAGKVKTQEEVDAEAQAVGIEWLEPYRNRRDRHLARCLTCQLEWRTSPASVHLGSGCPSCNSGGFDPGRPGILYVIAHEVAGVVKVGIASVDGERIARHLRRGWEVVGTRREERGQVVADAEAAVVAWFRNRGFRPVPKDAVPAGDGHSESVFTAEVSPEMVWRKATRAVAEARRRLRPESRQDER
jgi:hypothetical protein